MKIVSLVPSITELLYDLGLREEVVGITKFCVRPDQWHRTKTRIGGPKNIHIEHIRSLQPDWILAGKEENVKEQIEQLADFQILLTDVTNFDEGLKMIETIGTLVNKKEQAANIVHTILQNFSALQIKKARTGAYLIWQHPYMTVGGDTFIHSMMQKAGFDNVFANRKRYPAVTLDELNQINPNFILLSTEPYPFQQKHADELQAQVATSQVRVVDGEMFSWYGSRMLKAASYFQNLF